MKGKRMNIALVLKVAGVGLVVAVAYQILQKSGRDELATYVSLAGVVIVMLFLASEIDSLFRTIRRIFGI